MRQDAIRYYGERGKDVCFLGHPLGGNEGVCREGHTPPPSPSRETETASSKRVRLCSLFNEEWAIVCDEVEGHKGPHAARVWWGD